MKITPIYSQSELHWGAKDSGKQDECNVFETMAENAECPFQLILTLYNEAANRHGSKGGTFILNDGKVNEKSFWGGPNGNAIWYDKEYNNWSIGSSINLGKSIYSLYETLNVKCPHQANGNWIFADGINWLDAGNDVQIKMKDTGTLSKLFLQI